MVHNSNQDMNRGQLLPLSDIGGRGLSTLNRDPDIGIRVTRSVGEPHVQLRESGNRPQKNERTDQNR